MQVDRLDAPSHGSYSVVPTGVRDPPEHRPTGVDVSLVVVRKQMSLLFVLAGAIRGRSVTKVVPRRDYPVDRHRSYLHHLPLSSGALSHLLFVFVD